MTLGSVNTEHLYMLYIMYIKQVSYINGLMGKIRNSSALAMELCLFCFNSLRLSDAYMCQ